MTITVIGEGKVQVKPDLASLNLGVQATSVTATEALTHVSSAATALIAALKAAAISADDIVTSGLSVYPQYSSDRGVVSGYQASNNVTVMVRDIARTGSIIDIAASAAGDAITIGGVSFDVADAEAVIGAARAQAIQNAKKRANEYAQAAGVSVGRVLQISEVAVSSPFPRLHTESRTFAASAPIEPGMHQLAVAVTVVYELK